MVAELTKQLDIAVAEGRGLRVTSLACGPACEIVDLFESGRNVDAIHATLLDADPRALAAFYGKISRAPYRGQIQLVHGNLLELGELRCRANLRDQDVVFSLGLVDYFADAFVVDLLDYVYEVLRPGGQIILGNFHVRNQYRGLLDYVLDWVLIHRTEDDMKRLFAESRFRLCCDIFFEDQGINMFARAVKPPS
jgi:SAM-dependent methyltransferase